MDFEEKLMKAETSDDIKKMKIWLFQEQVRIQAKREELNDLSHELLEEKRTLERDRNALDIRIKASNERFRNNEVFMAKKQKIIEDAYRQLALDKKMLEQERLNFDYERRKHRKTKVNYQTDMGYYDGTTFFRGVDSQLALRKRYKDLLKIFHPDNTCGDTKTLLRIQNEYEGLRRQYYEM